MVREKIMQINATYGNGSTGKLALLLNNKAKSEGYDVLYAYSEGFANVNNSFKIETKLLNYLRRFLNKIIGKRQCHSSIATKRLIGYIKQEKPNLIHLHNIHHNNLNYIMLFNFLKDANLPVIYTQHDCWAFTGGCFHFTTNMCEQYKICCNECKFDMDSDDIILGVHKACKMKRMLIGNNKNIHIVCVSNWLKDVASISYVMKDLDICNIYNGIDTDIFKPTKSDIHKKYNINSDKFIILGVANGWNKGKGLELFLELAKRLDENYKIILIGLSNEQIGYIDDRIIGVSRINNLKELVEFYSCADVYINASKEETFGLTVVEAMACGTPVIVYNSTACKELVDNKSGFIVNNGITEFIGYIEKIKEIGKNAFSDNCRKRVLKYFDKDIMCDRYIDLYKNELKHYQ